MFEFTVMHEARVLGFEEVVPYACIAVEIEEEPAVLVVGNLIDAAPSEIRLGLRVQVDFEELPGGLTIPQFRTA